MNVCRHQTNNTDTFGVVSTRCQMSALCQLTQTTGSRCSIGAVLCRLASHVLPNREISEASPGAISRRSAELLGFLGSFCGYPSERKSGCCLVSRHGAAYGEPGGRPTRRSASTVLCRLATHALPRFAVPCGNGRRRRERSSAWRRYMPERRTCRWVELLIPNLGAS